MITRIANWFYSTWLGNLYFEFLLWRDRRQDKDKIRFLSPKETQQIIRQYSLMSEGVEQVKRKVNFLVHSKSPEEYDTVLRKFENLVNLAKRNPNSTRARFAEILQQTGDYRKVKDVENVTDRAKMIDKRLQDMRQLQDHVQQRTLLREIRKAKKQGDLDLASKLEQEWKAKYGRN